MLATIGDGLTYDDLLPHSRLILITEALSINVLNLDKIVAMKEKFGGEKDVAELPVFGKRRES